MNGRCDLCGKGISEYGTEYVIIQLMKNSQSQGLPDSFASQTVESCLTCLPKAADTVGMKYFCDDSRHLVCTPYSVDNLHKMARALGIKRCWFHGTHYDIPKKRIEEIQAKCEIVTPKRILEIIRGKS